jgi:hypothetical protein
MAPSGEAGQFAGSKGPLGGDALAAALAPALIAECGGPERLSGLSWFRSTYQRGGGLTGSAIYRDSTGCAHPVVVKLPVGGPELQWTVRLSEAQAGEASPCTPRVLAHGRSVGGFDFAWLVMEKLAGAGGQPVGKHVTAQDVRDMLTATARLERLARDLQPLQPDTDAKQIDFERVMEKSREVIRRGTVIQGQEAQHWTNVLKGVHRVLPTLLSRWRARPCNAWCHGDLHTGNAMRRADGSMVLLDLALMHPGHWVEDALYLERTSWGRPDGLAGVNPVKELALHRRELGMLDSEDYGRLACIRRVLTASCAPALIEREGSRAYLHAALEIIERNLAMASH